MKIIQIGPYPLSPSCIRGGVESSVYGLATQQLQDQHDVVVFDMPRLGGSDAQEQMSMPIYRYRNTGSHNEDACRRVPDMVRDIMALQPDVCHIHGTGPISWALYQALEQQGVRLMVTIHGLLRIEKLNALHRQPSLKHLYQFVRQSRVECRMLEHIPSAIIDTDYLRSALSHYPVRHLPALHTIPQGCNEAYFSLHCSPQSRIILCVGTYSQRKSQLHLIEAFRLLRQRGVEAKLVLAGIIAEKAYYEKVRAAVGASLYKNDITMHVDLPQAELHKLYEQAHVFALPTQEESQGIVFAEAMACGLPVVSTKVGGVPYVVEDGQCGFLSEYGDVASLSSHLESLLCDEALWLRMSEAATQTAKAYSWKNIASEIMNLYQAL